MLIIPPHLVEEVLAKGEAKDAEETYRRELLRQKKYRFRDSYPLHPNLEEEYEAGKGTQ